MVISQVNDDRITPYHCLKDRQLARELGLFVVEGEHLVRRLLASSMSVHSVFMTQARWRARDWNIPGDLPVYLGDKPLLSQVVGFDFHRGVLALGHRPASKGCAEVWSDLADVKRLLVCPEINDVENLGSIMRSAAGLGFSHLLLGPSCCDPWARRAIRTSMGTVFQLTLMGSHDLQRDLDKMYRECGFQWHATVIDAQAQPLDQVRPPTKVGLLLGSEAYGLAGDWMACVHQRVTIPMALQTDSLNVAVAAGIFMYHYRPGSQ